MGLAGPKRRTKISADPNNTRWTRDQTSFGHRMLLQQGWKPGDYLGAKDAAQASHYTAANASHVRVLLKDDNLGLGASRKNENAETFGLTAFSGLLGRLNGKDTAVLQKEAQSRRDIELRMYNDRKFGGIRFISAGFLVGDDMQKIKRAEVERQAAFEAEQVTKGKKRTASGDVKAESVASSSDDEAQPATTASATEAEDEKAAKKRRKEERKRIREERAQRRLARAADKPSKSERRQKKLEKRKARKAAEGKTAADSSSSDEATTTTATASRAVTESGVESGSASPAPTLHVRNNVRQRYIRQKRMAGLDPKALKEIFMIKTTA